MELFNLLFDFVVRVLTYHPNIAGLMVADPVTLTLLATTAANVGSSVVGSNAAGNSAQLQADSTIQGGREQRQFATDIYNADKKSNYDAGQWLKDYLPTYDMSKVDAPNMPDLSMFSAPDPDKYFSDANVNKYYDTAQGNLNNQMQTSVGNAQSSFGASAASRGLANPSAGLSMVGNQTAQNFIPQFGELETNRAGALYDNQKNLFGAKMQANQFNSGIAQQNFGNQMNSANFNSQQNQILNQLRQMGYSNQSNFAQNYGNPNTPYNPLAYPTYAPKAQQPYAIPNTNTDNAQGYGVGF